MFTAIKKFSRFLKFDYFFLLLQISKICTKRFNRIVLDLLVSIENSSSKLKIIKIVKHCRNPNDIILNWSMHKKWLEIIMIIIFGSLIFHSHLG